MNILETAQGSPAWHAHRANHFNASDAPAMLGLSPYKTRSELLREMATGITPEIDAATQRRFDDGHRFEALARPVAENILGEDLFPVVGYDGKLSASFDGLTMDGAVCFEHKTINVAYREAISTGQTLPAALLVQIEQQLMLSGATRCLFMASRWNDDDTLAEEVHCFVESDPELRKTLLQGWTQFAIDLENYQHAEVAERPVAEVSIELPALFVQAKGEITDSNMKAYGAALTAKLSEVRAIALITDQDFSNAKAAAAMFREQCKKLKLAKEAMLSQTVTIGEAARMIDAWSEDLRVTALQLEKDVEREDLAKKAEIVKDARSKYEDHIKALNVRIGGQYMPATNPDFAGALKSKRSYSSMHDAVDAMLANAKVEADMLADRIEANRNSLDGDPPQYGYWMFLFPDFASVCTKAPDDFAALLGSRIAAEEKRLDEAKKAEDARVAAAVEAERKAGEARAAEAARIAAEAEAAKAKQNAQEGSVAATRSEEVAQEAPVLSKEPMGEASMPGGSGATGTKGIVPTDLTAQPMSTINHFADAGKEIDAAMITEFLALQSCSPAAKKEMRAVLERWETYRLKMTAARGMAVAA